MADRSRGLLRCGYSALLAALIVACSGGPKPLVETAVGKSARPATDRMTCPELVFTQAPEGFELSDRELIPFSPAVVGVETTYSSGVDRQEIQLLSGGYADEVTETYDNLTPVRNLRVLDADAVILSGSLLTNSVRIVLWRAPASTAPCDLHAAIGLNISDDQFDRIVPLFSIKSR
jgi:hypothetical protein